MATARADDAEIKRLVQDEAMRLPDMGIVVSGIAGRYPKSDSVNEFEQNLYDGNDMVNDQDNARFTCALWGLPPRAGRLKDLSRFDAQFFGFTQDEANYTDFQLRILYEVVYESILDAGVNPAALRGTNTGVFFGLHCNEFENAMDDDPAFKPNGYYAQFAVRIAQYFDLRGITVTFDAACASAFVGLHNAVQAIDSGLIDQAIVCSSNIPIHPTGSFIFLQMQMLSPTGYSRFLDSRADGYVKSESCVSVLLQRKHAALRNYASVLVTMTSVDGYKQEGITFPSCKSQQELIKMAKDMAKVSTNHIEYFEAHGTGTPAGDPQEARAISSVYFPPEGDQDQRTIGPLLVGSVKTNMGHSEAASGLCALTKLVMMLENELVYQGLHYEQPNSNIEVLREGKLHFVVERRNLSAKIIPMSCYGFGGSNVHAILRANEKPAIDNCDLSLEPRLVIMFGRTQAAVDGFFNQLLNDTERGTKNCLSDDFLALIYALNSDKIDRLMIYRGYMLVDRNCRRELARSVSMCQLNPLAQQQRQQHIVQQQSDDGRGLHLQDCKQRACNVIFPGIGCQWPGMMSGLTNYEPFWSTIERLAGVLLAEQNIDLMQLLQNTTNNDVSLTATFVSIVAYQVALINIIKDQLKLNNLGPVVGHSLGEVSCAYAAGLISESECVLVAHQMGKTLDDNKTKVSGKMLAVGINSQEAQHLIANCAGCEQVQVCCLNGPESVTLSGPSEQIDKLCALATQQSLSVHQIQIPVALHNNSIMIPDIEISLVTEISKVLNKTHREKSADWIASFQSRFAQGTPEYFAECLCKRVDFLDAILQLEHDTIALELGPSGLFGSQLLQMATIFKPENANHRKFHYVQSMKRATVADKQILELLSSMGKLYQAGATFDLNNFYRSTNVNQYPVRRQTPSLSSIFQWNHSNSCFVPRYPVQFSKSSAKCELPIEIINDRDKYLAGHCIEGRVLFPATGYLYLIWRVFSFAKRRIFDACFQDVERELVPVEFHNVQLLRAVVLGNKAVQIYIHLEEATGRFEVKEGGGTVAEGFVRSPVESPNGLLYENVKDRIMKENLQIELNSDDIYKQFRVSGYDYGETFRNIEGSSVDGRFCRVKHNGRFIALTDSILQSIFLAVTQYAPSGGLFLPTRFEYARFQPDVILDKVRKAKGVFDLGDGSLNTQEKRKIMHKILEREAVQNQTDDDANSGTNEDDDEIKKDEEKFDCIFDTYCDPVTGVIITDGIEMRGIKATPAPRRSDNNSDVLMESYQFVADFEDPVQDEPLTKFNAHNKQYTRVCNAMSLKLLSKLSGEDIVDVVSKFSSNSEHSTDLAGSREIEEYKAHFMNALYERDSCKQGDNGYDIKKNGDNALLSVLDQLLAKQTSAKSVKEVVRENRVHLMRDLIQKSFSSERIMRSLIETVIENSCTKKMKLRMVEINVDDGIMRNELCQLMQSVEPKLSIDYSLAHPNIERLTSNNLISSNGPTTKTYTLKDLNSLLSNQQLDDLDLLVYKDISCYSLPKQVIEQNGLAPVMSSLNGAVRPGGYIMVIMRQQLTLAERVLLALSEPELVGLSRKYLDKFESLGNVAAGKIERINEILASRCKLLISEARRNNMIYLAKKSDTNGCTILLFKTNNDEMVPVSKDDHPETTESVPQTKRMLIRVEHDNLVQINKWLEDLKSQFKKENGEQQPKQADSDIDVWLCAIVTKQQPVSGLIGMIQALRRELGSSRLRCYYDEYTFKDCNKRVTQTEIEQCSRFQEALKRDHIWNCVDAYGRFGAFRHFTINNYLSYSECACINDRMIESDTTNTMNANQLVPGAYVNNSTRGDLSSFTWYEAPFKYLNEIDRNALVRVAYSALNFRDIMLATGRLPLDAIPIRLAMCDCLLGLEFSGFDMQGKRVMGMVFGRGIATHVVCPEQRAIKIEVPDWLDLRDAATIPVVYATAIMALVYRGRMQRGESVLIHAGSGGVGQAAIRLAAHFGLQIYTTVGTDDKRKFLLDEFPEALSNEHIFSSRDCNFEHQVLRATKGRGVDLVLNSLADDKLQASINCLADGGRFLEIGKYDMSVNTRLELLKLDTNKVFHGILLDKLFDTDDVGPSFMLQLQCVLDTLKDGLARGYVKPIKYTTFKRHQIEEAFRYMATGKHMGKILIEIDSSLDDVKQVNGISGAAKQVVQNKRDPSLGVHLSCVPRFQVSAEKSYIITGGLGGFGLELTKWLVIQGARHLVLTSRSGMRTGYQRATLQRLESNDGAKFVIADNRTADATTQRGAETLCKLASELAPSGQIGGIFHLAMILKDSLLENMSAQDFELVCRPKVHTCVHLDNVSRKFSYKLDYFVAFSSITSGKGNAGQANYAYANSCLERVCEQRRRAGQHGLAIQWGAIGDVGVAFENLGGNNIVIGGTIPQRMPSCLATLARVLGSPFSTCLSVVPVNRSASGSGEKGDLVDAIMHVLGIKDPSKVSEQSTLGDLGLDSLMAVEIRQYIEREYDKTLNMQEIRSLTIAKIREISENAELSGKKSASNDDDKQHNGVQDAVQMSEVASYGKMSTPMKSAQEMQQEAVDSMLDKNKVAAFVPKLELPKDEFCRLNYKHLDAATNDDTDLQRTTDATQQVGDKHNLRPIFFMPPIHGEFDRLELVCANIERPCIGLNWTRRLGRVSTMKEAVEIHVEMLQRADWKRQFHLPAGKQNGNANVDEEERVVDLVGYSYGATVAFELMLALTRIQARARKLKQIGRRDDASCGLRCGQLVLLDGSPRQVELGSYFLSSLTSKKRMKLAEKVDELLMVYVLSHTRKVNVDYVKFQKELLATDVDKKIALASERLVGYLNLAPAANGKQQARAREPQASGGSEGPEKSQPGTAIDEDNIYDDDDDDDEPKARVAAAMEAFCRRYELMSEYKATSVLPSDCTLVRAKEIFLSSADASSKFNDDLDLSSVVDGRVHLYVMEGDHETFLNRNSTQIGHIITKHLAPVATSQ